MEEELGIDEQAHVTHQGFINDDSTAVGRVHLGVLFRVDLPPTRELRVKEVDALSGEFRLPASLAPDRPRMETWSQFVFDAFSLFAPVADSEQQASP